MNSFLPRNLSNQVQEQNEYRIRQTTLRLRQLQRQLQQKSFKKEYVSSVIREENSIRKAIDEQNLLIFHLKQEILKLENLSIDCKEIQNFITALKQKYLALDKQTRTESQINHTRIHQIKNQNRSLHQLLKQLTDEIVRSYDTKVRLEEENFIVKELLNQRIKQKADLNEKLLDVQAQKDQSASQVQKLAANVQLQKVKNSSLLKNLQKQNSESQTNQKRLQFLEQQVKKYQCQKQKLLQIQKAAQRDNSVLKQCLKDNILKMKLSQEQFQKMSKQKDELQKKKQLQNQNLARNTKQNEQSKSGLMKQTQTGSVLNKDFEQLLADKYRAQMQIQKLSLIVLSQRQRQKQSLITSSQNQQQFEKNIYFIDQYVILNTELIRQIQLLISEEVNKESMKVGHIMSRIERTTSISQMKKFMSKANQQIWKAERTINEIKRSFNQYRVKRNSV